jgi:CTP-dependent riboflavin kinase
MLNEVLKLMAQERSLALTEMAQKLGWTIQRVENTIAQLENMRYIQKREIVSSSCGTGGCSACADCSSGKAKAEQSCQRIAENLYSWVITDRGKNALH